MKFKGKKLRNRNKINKIEMIEKTVDK